MDVAAEVAALEYAELLVDSRSPRQLGPDVGSAFVVLQKAKGIPYSNNANPLSANAACFVCVSVQDKEWKLGLRWIKGSSGLRASYRLSEAARGCTRLSSLQVRDPWCAIRRVCPPKCPSIAISFTL